MGDYISKEDVKQLVRDDNDKHGYSERFHNFSIKLWNLPSADVRENRWIPVSERLPEIHQDVLLSLRSLDVEVGFRGETEPYYYCHGDYIEPQNVLAWQPLPEPYKAERGE